MWYSCSFIVILVDGGTSSQSPPSHSHLSMLHSASQNLFWNFEVFLHSCGHGVCFEIRAIEKTKKSSLLLNFPVIRMFKMRAFFRFMIILVCFHNLTCRRTFYSPALVHQVGVTSFFGNSLVPRSGVQKSFKKVGCISVTSSLK